MFNAAKDVCDCAFTLRCSGEGFVSGVLGASAPVHDGEVSNGQTSTKQSTFPFCGVECNLDGARRLIQHMFCGDDSNGNHYRVDAVGVHLHQPCQLFSGETSTKINDRLDADKLVLLKPVANSQCRGWFAKRWKTQQEDMMMIRAIRSTPTNPNYY